MIRSNTAGVAPLVGPNTAAVAVRTEQYPVKAAWVDGVSRQPPSFVSSSGRHHALKTEWYRILINRHNSSSLRSHLSLVTTAQRHHGTE